MSIFLLLFFGAKFPSSMFNVRSVVWKHPSVKWNAFQNEFSNLFLLFYWIKEFILVLQLFSFAFKFVQTIMYCICIVAKPNHVILYIQNQSCPRNWEFCCKLLESECFPSSSNISKPNSAPKRCDRIGACFVTIWLIFKWVYLSMLLYT